MITYKHCPKCATVKFMVEFSKCVTRYDGVQGYCKVCCSEQKRVYCIQNREKLRLANKKYRDNKPWMRTWFAIRDRCLNPNNVKYKHYGGKGICVKITPDDLKQLWFRDKADELNSPSIDRVDSSLHYEFNNCRYIERTENSSRAVNGGKS